MLQNSVTPVLQKTVSERDEGITAVGTSIQRFKRTMLPLHRPGSDFETIVAGLFWNIRLRRRRKRKEGVKLLFHFYLVLELNEDFVVVHCSSPVGTEYPRSGSYS
jgi:hypothetical protein